MKFYIPKILFLLFVWTGSLAQGPVPQNIFFCPPPEALKKDPIKMNWSAANGWQSYGVSFVNQVHLFLGTQWAGAQVGQITCVYKGVELHSFPVLLVFHALTWEPKGGRWTKNLGGYRNCVSSNTQDCPFQIRLAPKVEDLYEEAKKLKSLQPEAPTESQPGF